MKIKTNLKQALTFNKRLFSYCLVISLILNAIFFLRHLISFKEFKKNGIVKALYVKSLNKNETTFFQRAKYTKVAKMYFVTTTGDTIHAIGKNIWAMHINELDEINLYLPLDSVIYNKNKPNNYQLISEFRNYSTTYSAFAYFFVGLSVFTIWFYLMAFIINKALSKN